MKKTTVVSKPKSKKVNNPLAAFFMGRFYPVLIAALVLAGHFTGLEFYINLVCMGLLSLSLLVCNSIRPLIVHLCTFIFQISKVNTPAFFEYEIDGVGSDHYTSEGRLYIAIACFSVVALALLIFFLKNGLHKSKNLSTLPLKFPSLLLALAFLLGGIFSESWNLNSLAFGAVEAFVWIILFYILLLGFKKERGAELLSYFVFVASIIVIILVAETVDIYLNTPNLFDKWGNISKEAFSYGWGICITASQSFLVLIPILFIGVANSKNPLYYLLMASVALVGVAATLSRACLAIGAVVYVLCMIIAFVKTKKKITCGIGMLAVVAIGAGVIIKMGDTVNKIIRDYILRGFELTGRAENWTAAWDAFLESPVFGKGFFGLGEIVNIYTQVDFLPGMAHNTILQFLGAMGMFGLACYAIYRICSLRPFVMRPTANKLMLFLAILTVLAGSLLDNFVFYFHPMFAYAVSYAIACKLDEERRLCID